MGFRQVVKIEAMDANTFFDLVEEMIAKGGKIIRGAPFLALPYEVSFEFINKEYVQGRPGVTDFGRTIMAEAVLVANYTQQQLEDMDWDAFREVCKVFGIKGRERSKMIEDYLAAQNTNKE